MCVLLPCPTSRPGCSLQVRDKVALSGKIRFRGSGERRRRSSTCFAFERMRLIVSWIVRVGQTDGKLQKGGKLSGLIRFGRIYGRNFIFLELARFFDRQH